MTKPVDYSNLERLAEVQRDCDLSPEDLRWLTQLLRDDPEARRHYVRYQLLNAELRTVLDGDAEAERISCPETFDETDEGDTLLHGKCIYPFPNLDPLDSLEFTDPSLGGGHYLFQAWPLAILASVAATTLGLLVMLWMPRSQPISHEPSVAKIVASMNASWNDGTILPDGAPLPAGNLKLDRGLAEIRFGDGANVILEGPVDCVLDSSSRMKLEQGRLSARVPVEAIGFTVHTDHATVVDLGTEFGVSNHDNTGTDVHVFRGQVALATPQESTSNPQLLTEGVGRSVKQNGSLVESIRANELAFVSPKEFEARLMSIDNSPYYRWLAFSYHLRRDPALMLYYIFDNAIGKPARVVNCAGATAGKLDGLFGDGETSETCPEWVAPGRWESQNALRFDGSRQQRVRVPSDNDLIITQAVTIAAWIRPNTALMEPEVPIVSKCQTNDSSIGPDYELGLSSQSATEKEKQWSLYFKAGKRKVASPKVNLVPGKWIHVAVTINEENAILYVNGKPIAREKGVEFTPHAGELWIGCTPIETEAGDALHKGPFEGLISELILARRVMSDQEIRQIWLAGTPDPS